MAYFVRGLFLPRWPWPPEAQDMETRLTAKQQGMIPVAAFAAGGNISSLKYAMVK
jgi:hypothetical protein